jgi:hypothetical protein
MKEPLREKAAFERHPEYFEITDCIIEQVHKWVDIDGLAALDSAVSFVKTVIIVRAFNMYRSINLLLRYDHWEDAAIIARSLFEFLLNLEEILRGDTEQDKKAKKFLKYSYLQEAIHTIKNMEYNILTNRAHEGAQESVQELKEIMDKLFAEFKDKKSPIGWTRSWSGQSTYKLAASSGNKIRSVQYNIIYSLYSALSHSSPYAALTTHTEAKPEEAEQLLAERRNQYEERNMSEAILLSTCWFMELLMLCHTQIPSYYPKWNVDMLQKVYKVFGIKSPDE